MRLFLLILTGFFLSVPGVPVRSDDVPVAPLSPVLHPEFGEVYEISNRKFQVVISAGHGAVMSIRQGGTFELLASPLRLTATASGKEKENWGGRAWRTNGGRQVVMLTRSLGPPHSLRIIHLFELGPDEDSFLLTTRITGTGPGDHTLIAPTIEMGLPLPEPQVTEKETEALQYGSGELLLKSHWQLEAPPLEVKSGSFLRREPDKIVYVSRPSENPDLPPQGWTLLCRFELKWNGAASAPASPVVLP